MARHPAGDGVDGVAHRDAACFEQLGELADGVLGLGDRQPVAGDDEDLVGVGEQDGDVLGAPRADGAVPGGAVGPGRRRDRPSRRR